MKNKTKNIIEIIFALLLIVFLTISINPFDLLMPTMIQMIYIGIFSTIFIVFFVFIWKESPNDEREAYHRLYAGKLAFMSGVLILAIGNIHQIVNHEKNIWLPIALGTMVLVKIVSLIWLTIKE